MEITIRDAQLADTPAIVRLIGDLAASSGESSPLTTGYAAYYLASPSSKTLLAEIPQGVVGLLSYSLRPDLYHAAPVCLIEELVVEEALRGRGMGRALVTELLARLAGTECAEISVAAMPDNPRAIQFYKAQGLTEEAVFLEKHFERP